MVIFLTIIVLWQTVVADTYRHISNLAANVVLAKVEVQAGCVCEKDLEVLKGI